MAQEEVPQAAVEAPPSRRVGLPLTIALIVIALLVGGLVGGVIGRATTDDEEAKVNTQRAGQLTEQEKQARKQERKARKREQKKAERQAEKEANLGTQGSLLDARAQQLDQQQQQLNQQQDQLNQQQAQLQAQIGQANASSFGDGQYAVGGDIQAGKYRASGGNDCDWATLASSDPSDVVADGGGDGPQTVDINTAYFVTQGCGTWSRVMS